MKGCIGGFELLLAANSMIQYPAKTHKYPQKLARTAGVQNTDSACANTEYHNARDLKYSLNKMISNFATMLKMRAGLWNIKYSL